jgi:hypothetical protein
MRVEALPVHEAELISPALVVAGILAGAGVPGFVMPPAAIRAQAASPAAAGDFTTFLARVDAAQLELQNGRPAAFKALWSRADEVTLSGGFGGTIENGGPPSAAGSIGWPHGQETRVTRRAITG